MSLHLPRTLFGQIMLAQLLLFGTIAILLPVVLVISLHRTTDALITSRLKTDVNRIALILASPSAYRQRALDHALGPLYHPHWATRAYRVLDGRGRTVFQGGADTAFPLRIATRPGFTHDGNLDVLQDARPIGRRFYLIAVAQDRARPEVMIDDVVATFLRRTIWIVPLIFLGSSLLSLLFLRRLTATMRHVARDAEHIGPESLDTRLSADRLPMEARSLAIATNLALDRVEQGYRRQASFVSSVAHELRTPLALVSLRCDALDPGADKEALRRAIDQCTHVVSQLMELAVIEGRKPAVSVISLDSIVREAVETSAPLVYRSGRTIEAVFDGGPASGVIGNESLLHIALSNLIDNAVRHTPPGTHIVLCAMQDMICVRDNGPGLLREESGEAGTRYRSASLKRSDGAGLGLSIVQRIMAAMDGAMIVAPGGIGAHIHLRLQWRKDHDDVAFCLARQPGSPIISPSA